MLPDKLCAVGASRYKASGKGYLEMASRFKEKGYTKWPWFAGFSTWGFNGAVITQLHRGDGRYGSHICHGCKISPTCTGNQGDCHTSVFCRDVAADSTCGDGKIQKSKGETCDDGNRGAGDGCSGTCKIEPGFTCTTKNFHLVCQDKDECKDGSNDCAQKRCEATSQGRVPAVSIF